jgi:hypothetical protein
LPREFGHLGGLEVFDRFPDYRRVLVLSDSLRRLVSFSVRFVVRGDRQWCFAEDANEYPLVGATFGEMVRTLADLSATDQPLQHHLQPQTDNIPGSVVFDDIMVVESVDEGIERLAIGLGTSLPAVTQLHMTGCALGTL